MFTKTGGSQAKKLETVDDRTFEFGETKRKFSESVFHGTENSELGLVVMVTIKVTCKKVVFASDIQGPMYTPTIAKILAERPQIVIVGGTSNILSWIQSKR